MKKILLLAGVLFITGCDSNVDITKYPESVQRCYNSAYYHTDKCSTDKAILKYCECFTAKSTNIDIKINESWNAGPRSPMLSHALDTKRDKLLDEAAADCAKKTGYTMVADCKK